LLLKQAAPASSIHPNALDAVVSAASQRDYD
jgi:hypothetical protein